MRNLSTAQVQIILRTPYFQLPFGLEEICCTYNISERNLCREVGISPAEYIFSDQTHVNTIYQGMYNVEIQ